MQETLQRELLQSIDNTRSALASLLESTSKILYLASKRSPAASGAGVPNTENMEELQQTLREEEARLLQLVDELVQSYVRSLRMAEEHKHKIEQLDLEQSSYCQPFSEKLVQLSQQIWEKERKLEEFKRRIRSFRRSLDLQPNWDTD